MCFTWTLVFSLRMPVQPSDHGRVRVEGFPPEHLADDRMRGATVSRRQAHPERFREQVRRG